VADHLGTPRMVFDGTAGTIASADYGPFGEELAVAGVPRRAGYIDRERDPETELANFGVRAYDPDRGAFASPEPLWPAMPGMSPYAYVGNDPLGYTDRSGLSGESPQSTPLEPASSGSGDVEQGLRWWQIERLLGNSGPDDGRLGQRKPKRRRDRVVMGPPSPPKGDRGAKVVPPPIIVEAPSHATVSAFTVGIVGLGIVMRASGAMTAMEVTSGASVALAADDVTGIGVVDDILIPVVAAIGVATVVYLLTSYALSEGGEDAVEGKEMTPDQRALKDIVNDATNKGRKPLTKEEAETILDWADEVNYPGRRAKPADVASPSNWHANPVPHIHIPSAGRGGHVPVEGGVQPR